MRTIVVLALLFSSIGLVLVGLVFYLLTGENWAGALAIGGAILSVMMMVNIPRSRQGDSKNIDRSR